MAKGTFNRIPVPHVKRSHFDLSHERKFSMKMGYLVPILLQEVVPGDSFRVNTEHLVRFAPLISPVMHRVNVFTHYFFVPNRLVFDDWQEYITGGESGESEVPLPLIRLGRGLDKSYISEGSLCDYFGLPVWKDTGDPVTSVSVNALPFRAMTLIYNDYYRDQNLEGEIPFSRGSVVPPSDYSSLLTLRRRYWEKDYFTSCLPFTQRGGEVTIPLLGRAPVTLDYSQFSEGVDYPANMVDSVGGSIPSGRTFITSDGGEIRYNNTPGGTEPAGFAYYDPQGTLVANLDAVTSSTINDLRRAFCLQRFLERGARGGSRYREFILSHFGILSSDSRLQRPEYLGGGKSPVVISEVLQTSSTDDVTPQGNMSGHGVSVSNTHQFKRSFEEHGYIIGIMSVLPVTSYSQGIPRHFLRRDRLDYYWPDFAHLGEQAVEVRELYYDYDIDDDLAVSAFGYLPRYEEYRSTLSSVHGAFRSSYSFWHMGRLFDAPPSLNIDFLISDPTKRIFSVTDPNVDELFVNLYNNVQAIRPIPRFGVPI